MYAKVITEGKYIGFWGPVNNGDIAVQSATRRYSGAIGAIDRNAKNLKTKVLYVIDNRFGIAKPLNRVVLKKMLESYPGLLQNYQNEPDMEDPETMLYYLVLINSNSGH